MDITGKPVEKAEPEAEEPSKGVLGTIIEHSEAEKKPTFWERLGNTFKGDPKPAPTKRTVPQIKGLKTKPSKTAPSQTAADCKDAGPDMRLRAFMAPPMTAIPDEKPAKKGSLRPSRANARKAYWDVAAAFSLIVNAILVGALVLMAGQVRNLKTMMNGLLGGLYSNFVQMDNATIHTTIPVEAQIPIVFNLPIQQNTSVMLTADVAIPGTRVVINTAGLSINADANVTLPQGTNLPISLNMDVPVQVTIPISLQVPVDIPMNKTELHTPFTGLQQTIRPLYCTINKSAQYPQGIYICQPSALPTAIP
jgi:hypothetical protein